MHYIGAFDSNTYGYILIGMEDKKHCQICERDILANNAKGLMAHHGYRRPHGEGWQSDSCWGARHLPYEKSCDQIQPCIDHIKAFVERQEVRLKDFMTNPPETLTRASFSMSQPPRIYKRPEGFDAKVNDERGSWSGPDQMYGYEHHSTCQMIRYSIRDGKKDIARLEKRLLDWKPVK